VRPFRTIMTSTTTTIIIWVGSAFYYISVIFLVILWMGDKSLFPSATTILGVYSFSTNAPLMARWRSISTITTVDDNEYFKVSASFSSLGNHPRSSSFQTQLSAVLPTTNGVTSSSSSSSSSSFTENSETSTSSQTPPLRVIQGIREVIDNYDVFLLDMWYALSVSSASSSSFDF
jgi:hypothetical protein